MLRTFGPATKRYDCEFAAASAFLYDLYEPIALGDFSNHIERVVNHHLPDYRAHFEFNNSQSPRTEIEISSLQTPDAGDCQLFVTGYTGVYHCTVDFSHARPFHEETISFLLVLSRHIVRAFERLQPPELNSEMSNNKHPAERLTQRELEVLSWIIEGKRDAEIARILGISCRTVSKHVTHVLSKLEVETRTAAVFRAHTLSFSFKKCKNT